MVFSRKRPSCLLDWGFCLVPADNEPSVVLAWVFGFIPRRPGFGGINYLLKRIFGVFGSILSRNFVNFIDFLTEDGIISIKKES